MAAIDRGIFLDGLERLLPDPGMVLATEALNSSFLAVLSEGTVLQAF